jgi:hypothetical protein
LKVLAHSELLGTRHWLVPAAVASQLAIILQYEQMGSDRRIHDRNCRIILPEEGYQFSKIANKIFDKIVLKDTPEISAEKEKRMRIK